MDNLLETYFYPQPPQSLIVTFVESCVDWINRTVSYVAGKIHQAKEVNLVHNVLYITFTHGACYLFLSFNLTDKITFQTTRL